MCERLQPVWDALAPLSEIAGCVQRSRTTSITSASRRLLVPDFLPRGRATEQGKQRLPLPRELQTRFPPSFRGVEFDRARRVATFHEAHGAQAASLRSG